MKQFVQAVLLESSFSSSEEAKQAMERFVEEQEQKKEQTARAEEEYEEWNRAFLEETTLLEQLYGQRLIQMQKEQLAMEEYNNSLRNNE